MSETTNSTIQVNLAGPVTTSPVSFTLSYSNRGKREQRILQLETIVGEVVPNFLIGANDFIKDAVAIVHNQDTVATTVNFKANNPRNTYTIFSITLDPGDTYFYKDGVSQTITTNGQIKTSPSLDGFTSLNDIVSYNGETPGLAEVLVGDGTSFKKVFRPEFLAMHHGWYFYTDFTGIGTVWGGIGAFTGATSGTGSSATIDSGPYGGTGEIGTGTTATGRGSYQSSTTAINPSHGPVVMEFRTNVPVASTTGIEQFTGWFGLSDGVTTATPSDGAFFYYDQTVSSNWILRTRSASVTSDITSTVAVDFGAYHAFRLELNSLTQKVYFYIDGILEGTESINFPTGSLAITASVLKSVGITARELNFDYIWGWQRYYSPRTDYTFESLSGI